MRTHNQLHYYTIISMEVTIFSAVRQTLQSTFISERANIKFDLSLNYFIIKASCESVSEQFSFKILLRQSLISLSTLIWFGPPRGLSAILPFLHYISTQYFWLWIC